jgi:hypothetical protein
VAALDRGALQRQHEGEQRAESREQREKRMQQTAERRDKIVKQ